MIDGGSVLGLITARGGSKAVPGKNIRPVAGKPLIVFTIEAARAARHIDRLILSSDDDSIIAVARAAGCEAPFKREQRLATDEAVSIDVVRDALQRCPGYDWVVLLQPTSPLRTAEDIDAAIECCVRLQAPACVSVCEVEQNPYWMRTIGADGRLTPVLPNAARRRQDLPHVFMPNGAVYVGRTAWLLQGNDFSSPDAVAYVMPPERSLDIDSEADLRRVRFHFEGS